MSSDVTILRFDLDEATVRRVLSALPGVTPLSPADESETDGKVSARDAADGGPTPDGASGATDAGPEEGDHAGTAAEPKSDPARTRWSPWPGAPSATDDEDDGWSRRRKALVGVGLLCGLGLLAVALYVLVGCVRGDSDGDGGARDEGDGPDGSGGLPSFGDPTAASEDEADAQDAEDEDAARSHPIDVSPLVGMAFLAALAGLVRRVRARPTEESEADEPASTP